MVVHRGALRRFDALRKRTAELPVEVVWDRREADRRTSSSSVSTGGLRQRDRRQRPSFTWELAAFVVVEGHSTKHDS